MRSLVKAMRRSPEVVWDEHENGMSQINRQLHRPAAGREAAQGAYRRVRGARADGASGNQRGAGDRDGGGLAACGDHAR